MGGHLKELSAGGPPRPVWRTRAVLSRLPLDVPRPLLSGTSSQVGRSALAFLRICFRLTPEPTALAERCGAVAAAAGPLTRAEAVPRWDGGCSSCMHCGTAVCCGHLPLADRSRARGAQGQCRPSAECVPGMASSPPQGPPTSSLRRRPQRPFPAGHTRWEASCARTRTHA